MALLGTPEYELCNFFTEENYKDVAIAIIACRNQMMEELAEYAPSQNVAVATYLFGGTQRCMLNNHRVSLFERAVEHVMSDFRNPDRDPKSFFLYSLFIRFTAILHNAQLRIEAKTPKDVIKREVNNFIDDICFNSLEIEISAVRHDGKVNFDNGGEMIYHFIGLCGLIDPTRPLARAIFLPLYSDIKPPAERALQLHKFTVYLKIQLKRLLYSSINELVDPTFYTSQDIVKVSPSAFPCRFLDFLRLRNIYVYPRYVLLPLIRRMGDTVYCNWNNRNRAHTVTLEPKQAMPLGLDKVLKMTFTPSSKKEKEARMRSMLHKFNEYKESDAHNDPATIFSLTLPDDSKPAPAVAPAPEVVAASSVADPEVKMAVPAPVEAPVAAEPVAAPVAAQKSWKDWFLRIGGRHSKKGTRRHPNKKGKKSRRYRKSN